MLSRGGACPVARQLALALNSAAKRRDPEAAVAIFESHAASAGGALPLQSYNTVLALLTDHPSERARVRQHMREHKVRADETTVTLDVRSLVARGDVDAALAALSEAEASGVSPKRRTYSAVLTALCDSGDVGRSEALVGQMRRAAVEPGEDDIVQLAALLASAGERGRLEGALECLQRAVPQLQPASFARLQASLDAPTEGLKTRHAAVDAAGRCDSCGEVLAAVDLTSDQRAHMRVALLDAAEATGGDNLQGDLQRDLRRDLRRDLERFGDWVASRWAVSQGGGPRYIIDGANVAYRNQNFVGGGFSFEQVEIARRDLAAAGGAEPVLVLPARYLAAGQVPNHTKCALAKAASSQGQEDASPGRAASGASLAVAAGHARSESGHGHGGYTAVTERDAALVSRWREAGALWTCPDEASDDRYWMLAAALGGETARVLTNDEMRDHAFRLAAPGSGTAHQPAATARDVHAGDGRTQAVVPGWFHRWRARVLVRFDFSHGAAPGRPEPTLLTRHPPPFSLEIQRGLAAWHFPRATDQAWLCATGFGPPAASGATAAHGGAVEVDVQDRRPAEDGGLTGAGDVSAKRPRRDPP